MISVIIPVYNAEKYLQRCLQSVQNQVYSDFECICVDDGSLDSSAKILNDFSSADQRFRCFHENNAGPSAARNLGLDVATGEYIAFIDADDSIEPDYLNRLLDGITQSGADVCCCGYKYIGRNSYRFNDFFPVVDYNKASFLTQLFKNTGGCICSTIYKSEIIQSNHIRFDLRYRLCEDQLFKMNYFLQCDSFFSIDYYGYNYIEAEGSLSKHLDYGRLHQQLDLLQLMRSTLEQSGFSAQQTNCLLAPKEKSVIMQLANSCDGHFVQLFHDNEVMQIINRIKIATKSDLKWLLPVKWRIYPLLKLLYTK